jgi:hypothetical protein
MRRHGSYLMPLVSHCYLNFWFVTLLVRSAPQGLQFGQLSHLKADWLGAYLYINIY